MKLNCTRKNIVTGLVLSTVALTSLRLSRKLMNKPPAKTFTELTDAGNAMLQQDVDLYRHCLTLRQYSNHTDEHQQAFVEFLFNMVRIVNMYVHSCDKKLLMSYALVQRAHRMCTLTTYQLKTHAQILLPLSVDEAAKNDLQEVVDALVTAIAEYQFNITSNMRVQIEQQL